MTAPAGWWQEGDHLGPLSPAIREALAGATLSYLVREMDQAPPPDYPCFWMRWERAGQAYTGQVLEVSIGLDDDPAIARWTLDTRAWSTPTGQARLLDWLAVRLGGRQGRGRPPKPSPSRQRQKFLARIGPLIAAEHAAGHYPGLRRLAVHFSQAADPDDRRRVLVTAMKRAGYTNWRSVLRDLSNKDFMVT